MNYLVIELQTTAGTTANIVNQYDNLPQAEQQFYTVCSSAVVSSVPIHAVAIIDDHGFPVKNECFTHVEPEPELNT
jgi:hypothetical protein